MPTYHARDVRISLGTSSLADSTIAEPAKRRGNTGSVAVKQQEAIVRTCKFLKESLIPCPDDHRNLRLLGQDENIPFFFVSVNSEEHEEIEPEKDKSSMRLRSSGNASTVGSIGHIRSRLSYGSDSEPVLTGSPKMVQQGASVGSRRKRGPRLTVDNLTRVGQDITKQETPLSSPLLSPLLRAASVDPGAIPLALSLKIELSKNAFLTNLRGNEIQDVRYDVFYNGELADSNYVPHSKSLGSTVCFISGQRVHMFVERPWIITRPGQNAKGELKVKSTAKRSTAQDRWDLIRESLGREAKQLPVNASGGKSPVAEFLISLGGVELPAEVESGYKSGASKFGVIDVVLSTGVGIKKSINTQYLTRPTILSPMRDFEGLGSGLDLSWSNADLPTTPTPVRTRSFSNRRQQVHGDSPLKNSILATDLDADVVTDSKSGLNKTPEPANSTIHSRDRLMLDFRQSRSTRGTRLKTELDLDSSSSEMRKSGTSMPTPPVRVGGSLTLANQHSDVPSGDGGPPKRRRKTPSDTSKLLVDGITIDEFFGAEENEQTKPPNPKSLIIRLRAASIAAKGSARHRPGTTASQPLEASDGDVTKQDKAGQLRKSGRRSTGTERYHATTKPKADTQSGPDAEFLPSSKRDTRSRSRGTYQPAPPPRSMNRLPRGTGTWDYEEASFAQELDREWGMPELSRDCVATYAEDGPWLKEAGDSGFLRQVKSVKGGAFQETQVLLGVRFVII